MTDAQRPISTVAIREAQEEERRKGGEDGGGRSWRRRIKGSPPIGMIGKREHPERGSVR